MKKVSLFGLIFVWAIVLCGCFSWLQISPSGGGVAIDLVAFNAGCVGIVEAPEIIGPAAVLAKDGLKLVNDGSIELSTLIKDIGTVLNVNFSNKILQANIDRMLDNIQIMLSPDVDVGSAGTVKAILLAFVDGVERCK